MKPLLTILFLCIVSDAAQDAFAQQGSQWIDFSPSDKSFHISMPHEPKLELVMGTYDLLSVSGNWYCAGSAGASYAIWSLRDHSGIGWDEESGLDAAADLFWQVLLKPARDKP